MGWGVERALVRVEPDTWLRGALLISCHFNSLNDTLEFLQRPVAEIVLLVSFSFYGVVFDS